MAGTAIESSASAGVFPPSSVSPAPFPGEAAALPRDRVSLWAQIQRVLHIVYHALRFVGRSQFARLARVGHTERLAREGQWLRESAIALGGTFVKLAQQASIRRDVLPEAYCSAFDDLQDTVPPIAFDDVVRLVEAQLRRPLASVFRVIDRAPIGSASVGCVYRAELNDGTEVAVKVRRPGIAAMFALDLAVMERLVRAMQHVGGPTLGLSVGMVEELRHVLEEELDFRSEARYQELFRRAFRHWKKVRITAPRPFYSLSGSEVFVSHFVRGISLKEMLLRLRAEGETYRAHLASLDIDPGNIARRLVRGLHFQVHECPFFHADPHPGNIIVQPGGQLVFLDFGACGVMPARDRRLLVEMNRCFFDGDVVGMVQCVTSIMEPLPHVNTDALTSALEREWWRGYYGIISRHSDWHERTSFRLWTVLMVTLRRFEIPLPSRMLKMVRATLLYDTVAAQLDGDINVFHEFLKFTKAAAKRRRNALRAAAIRQVMLGPDDAVVDRVHQFGRVAGRLMFRAEKFLNEPDIRLDASLNLFVGLVEQLWSLGVTVFATLSSLWLVSYSWRRFLFLYHPESSNSSDRLMDLPASLIDKMRGGEWSAFLVMLGLVVGAWWMSISVLGIAQRLRHLLRQRRSVKE